MKEKIIKKWSIISWWVFVQSFFLRILLFCIGALVFVVLVEDKPLNSNWDILITITKGNTLVINWYTFISGVILLGINATLILGTVSWLLSPSKLFENTTKTKLRKFLQQSDANGSGDSGGTDCN